MDSHRTCLAEHGPFCSRSNKATSCSLHDFSGLLLLSCQQAHCIRRVPLVG